MMKRILGTVLTALVITIVAGCGSDSTPTSTGGGPTVKSDPSLAADIQDIFDRRGCSATPCHGSSKAAGLMLSADSSWSYLVNVTATQDTLLRVLPGDTVRSYLIAKLEGSGTTGDQMPKNDVPLDSIDLQNIKNWITQGAKNN